ncbi:hypothetical protein BJ085DRAFT_36301 [Dimargaris cristalligena]|uniref:Large ribosomal subunit protein mL53 n=1 Tax=Dimargaris cristalligena TaxID=215637 RepID=A0A4P9ZXB5_9FUNG|nr:hypothetical protein BJ085DRAFT_36301 [Dimargaris cristalligena]|eukprot:RKP38277.1 hypothetical protein BJ085DRAFT_36301 [Dimargaris cristalligena]
MLKFVNQVKVTFTPYGEAAGSAKLFLNRILTNDNLASNPKCKLDVKTPEDINTVPSVQIVFRDGKDMQFNATRMKPEELVEAMTKYSRKLQEEEDNRG